MRNDDEYRREDEREQSEQEFLEEQCSYESEDERIKANLDRSDPEVIEEQLISMLNDLERKIGKLGTPEAHELCQESFTVQDCIAMGAEDIFRIYAWRFSKKN